MKEYGGSEAVWGQRGVQEGIRGYMGGGAGAVWEGCVGGAGHTFQVDVSWKALLLCPPTIIDY